MRPYKLIYSATSKKQIQKFHPQIKPLVKSKLEKLRETPYSGKGLERELSGYLSIRAKKFRIVYKISGNNQAVEIHHVGHRKDIYQLFKEAIDK